MGINHKIFYHDLFQSEQETACIWSIYYTANVFPIKTILNFTVIGGKFKFQAQDSFFGIFFFEDLEV